MKDGGENQIQRFAYGKRQDIIESTLRKNIFFIMGMPKSGTTWLVQLLNAHPEISCWGEGHLTNMLYPIMEKALKDYDKRVTKWHNQFQKLGLDQQPPRFTVNDLYHLFITATGILFTRALEDPSVTCIGEKTPDNLYSVNRLSYLFPDAKFIHMIRDGRDGAVSGYNMRKAMKEKNFEKNFSDFAAYAKTYAANWAAGIKKGREFAIAQPSRYIEVKYEDLHADSSAELRKIFPFLQVSVTDEILKTASDAGSFEKLSKGRDRGEEKNDSFFRKGIVGDFRNSMDEKAYKVFMAQAGDMIREMGYEDSL